MDPNQAAIDVLGAGLVRLVRSVWPQKEVCLLDVLLSIV